MKKSEAFRLAQLAVTTYGNIGTSDKLKVLRVLMQSEDLAKFSEHQEAKEKEA